MRTKRSITINNSFVHGICNCSCVTCHINKPTYQGPKTTQTREMVQTIADRVREAEREGLYIRAIGNSGDGEPTLHPEFADRMAIFGDLIRNWRSDRHPAPDVCIVTNGLKLSDPEIIRSLVENRISLKISFPTSNPEHYAQIMQPVNQASGPELFQDLMPALENVMKLKRQGHFPRLEFHVSPPYYEHLYPDFPATVEFLAEMAGRQGLADVNLKMFPVLANRGGTVKGPKQRLELYHDYFKRFNNRRIHGVRVNMFYSYDFFYPNLSYLFDLWRAFDYPCLWFGNIYLSPFGESGCPNDQSVEDPEGNILTHSLREIMEIKETRIPGPVCKACNQKPWFLARLGILPLFHWAAARKWRRHGAVAQRRGRPLYAKRAERA